MGWLIWGLVALVVVLGPSSIPLFWKGVIVAALWVPILIDCLRRRLGRPDPGRSARGGDPGKP